MSWSTNEESVSSINQTRSALNESCSRLSGAVSNLENVYTGNAQGLGPHAAEIGSLLEGIKSEQTIAEKKVQLLSIKLGKASAIRERIINNNRYKGSQDGVADSGSSGAGKGSSSSGSGSGTHSISYGELDSLGRTTGIEATITKDMIGTGSSASASIRPAGFAGQAAGHARGHLLGNQLGGSGNDPRNLVTLFQNPVNHPVMSSIESKVRKIVEEGQTVDYKVTPIYKGNELIPLGITIEAKGSKGFTLIQTILNRRAK